MLEPLHSLSNRALGVGKVASILRLRLGLALRLQLRFERRLRLPNALDGHLFVRDTLRHAGGHAVTLLTSVGLIEPAGTPEPLADLVLQLRFPLTEPFAFSLAIERQVSERGKPRLTTQIEHLHKQARRRPHVGLAKSARRTKIEQVQPRHCHCLKIKPLGAALRDLSQGIHSLTIRVQQQRRHHRRMIGRIASLLSVLSMIELKIPRLAYRVGHDVR